LSADTRFVPGTSHAVCGRRECVGSGSAKSRWAADDNPSAREEDRPMNPSRIRAQLARLHLERIDAEKGGLSGNETYMADLEEEILECRAVLALATITELAVARAEASGRMFG
jgi:hypothetical protein